MRRIEARDMMESGKIRRSDWVLGATAASWAACTTILAVQLEDFANPDCYPRTLVLLLAVLYLFPAVFLFGAFVIRNSVEEEGRDGTAPWFGYPHGFMGTALRAARAALFGLPFIFLLKAVLEEHGPDYNVCYSLSLVLPLILVIFAGHIAIWLLMASSSGYGLLLALLFGVVSVSFAKDYSHSHLHHRSYPYYSYFVFALSLLTILLCDIYLSLLALESPNSHPLPKPHQILPTTLDSVL